MIRCAGTLFPFPGQAQSAVIEVMPEQRSKRFISNKQMKKLLLGLNSADAGPAWAKFIDRFAPLIMKTARQFDYEQDRSSECFLHVCEKLCDNGFRRLLRFDPNGSATFHTWLGAVTFNLCVDWHRKEFGRVSLLPAISALPAFDQAVFRYRYERGMTIETCFHLLTEAFPDLTRQQLSDAISRVHTVLTPRQRWKMSLRVRDKPSSPGSDKTTDAAKLPASAPGPESEAQQQQERALLEQAMTLLPADQRLLLRLRFHQGLTLKEVARLTQLGDSFRARRHIQAALGALAEVMRSKKFRDSRKN